MTNLLEKHFFDAFGIEPIKFYLNNVLQIDYPEITDRRLLELTRIIGKKPFGYLQCENTYSTNLGDIRDMITVEADSLKEGLLTLAMQNKVVLRIKHQVRTLFEEG